MRISRSERGSAVILAMVIVIIVVGISGAFLAESIIRSKVQYSANQADEAQMICDAVLEKTRRALWLYRAAEKGAAGSSSQFLWKWDDLLTYNQALGCWKQVSGVNTNEVDRAFVWNTYQSVKSQDFFISYLTQLGNTSTPLDQVTLTGTTATTPGNPTTPSTADGDYDGAYSSDAVFIGWSRPFGRGAYYVAIRDNEDETSGNDPLVDTDNSIVVTVIASLPEGTQRSIEALVEYPEAFFDPQAGLLSDGDIDLGNGNVTSPSSVPAGGKVHTNGNMIVGANANASSVNAVGEVTTSSGGAPPGSAGTVNDATSGTAPAVLPIPDVIPQDYLTNSLYNSGNMYILEKSGSGGNATIKAYNVNADGTKGSENATVAAGWNLQNANQTPATARVSTTSYVPGVYYTDLDLDLNGPNNGTSTIVGTFITEQNVSMGGNSSISPFVKQTNSNGDIIAATTVIAKKDLTISGNSTSDVQTGVFLAGEQVQLNGTVNVQGSVIAKDNPNSNGGGSGADSFGAQVVGNGSTISYNQVRTLIPLREDAVKVKNVRRMGLNK